MKQKTEKELLAMPEVHERRRWWRNWKWRLVVALWVLCALGGAAELLLKIESVDGSFWGPLLALMTIPFWILSLPFFPVLKSAGLMSPEASGLPALGTFLIVVVYSAILFALGRWLDQRRQRSQE